MDEVLFASYEGRVHLLNKLRDGLERETVAALAGTQHIDRISFRVKSPKSFVKKVLDPRNDPPYTEPLFEVEDQVAGRVIVFFIDDLDIVKGLLQDTFNTVLYKHRRPPLDAQFGYESHHLICNIPPHVKPRGWNARDDLPPTFELQIRTIFMHAYAEPQHDIGYKSILDLPPDIRRELAWVAASSWGADQAFRRVWEWYRSGLSDASRGAHHLDSTGTGGEQPDE